MHNQIPICTFISKTQLLNSRQLSMDSNTPVKFISLKSRISRSSLSNTQNLRNNQLQRSIIFPQHIKYIPILQRPLIQNPKLNSQLSVSLHEQGFDIRNTNNKPCNELESNYIHLNPEKQIKGISVISNQKGAQKLLAPSQKLEAKNIEESKLSIQIKAQRSLIKLKEAAQIPAMITLRASGGFRTNLDLICVIDNSGSMAGEKMQLSKKAMKYILEVLQDKDRLSIITFSDSAVELSSLKFVNGENKQLFDKTINRIQATNGTNISSGLDLALKILRQRKFVNEATSIFLLSDGENDGSYQSPKIKFQRDLNNEINKNISSFTLHSFGFGQDHDEDIMSGLAQLKDGSFYFVKQLSTIDEAFCNALGGIMSIVASDISIYFSFVGKNLAKDINIKKTYGKIDKINEKLGQYQIKLSSIASEVTKDFVFELDIPKINADVGDFERNHQIIKVSFTAKKPNGQLIMGGCSLIITLINQFEIIQDSIENVDVIENYFRVKTAQEISNSLKKADEQKFDQAKKNIDKMINEIQSSKARKIKKDLLINDLKDIKQRCSAIQWRSEGRKISTNIMSSHTGQNSYNYSSPTQTIMRTSLLNSKINNRNP